MAATIEALFVDRGDISSGSSATNVPIGGTTEAYDTLSIVFIGGYVLTSDPVAPSVSFSDGTWTKLAEEVEAVRSAGSPGSPAQGAWWSWWTRLVAAGDDPSATVTVGSRGVSSGLTYTYYRYRNMRTTPSSFASGVDSGTTNSATSGFTDRPITLTVTSTAEGAAYTQVRSGSYGWANYRPDDHPDFGDDWTALPNVPKGTVTKAWAPNSQSFASGHFLTVIRAAPDGFTFGYGAHTGTPTGPTAAWGVY